VRTKDNLSYRCSTVESDRLLDWAAQLMSYICKLYSCCYGWWLVVEYVKRVFGQLARASTTMIQPSASQDQIFYFFYLRFGFCFPEVLSSLASVFFPH